ncbi:MAG: hypothetical protein Q7J73_03665 [Dehalococcoidales bacterium]|nr:hypothetical protein [Dehalococcoidales bacterium]
MQFAVDAEGDIYGNNLILTGSTSTGTTTVAGGLTVEGNTQLGDTTTDTLTVYPATLALSKEAAHTIQIADSTTANTAGGALTIKGAAGAATNAAGGAVNITAGAGAGSGNGGAIVLTAGAAGASGTGGAISLTTTTGIQTFTSSVVTGITTSSAFVFTDSALTSGTLNYLTSSSVTTGRLLDVATTGNTWTGNGTTNGLVNLASSSTAGTASSSDILLNIARSGTNAQLAHTAYGVYSAVTNTNVTSGTNVAGYFSASGAQTANYGLIVENGNVGIGTTAPTSFLHVDGAATATALSTFSRSMFDNTNAITTNTGNTQVFGLAIDEPNILIGTVTPTNSASLYVSGAATEATTNYALWVDAGTFRFDSGGVINEDANNSDLRIESVSNTNFLFLDANGMTNQGSVGFGRAPQNLAAIETGGTLTIDTANIVQANLLLNSVITSADNASNLAQLWVRGSLTTPSGSDTYSVVSTAYFDEPNITKGATDTITNATTIYVKDAPTEGSNNYALWVDAGATQLDGTLDVNGATTLAALTLDAGSNFIMSSGTGTYAQTNAQTTDATADATTITLSAGGTGETGVLRGLVISQSDTATTGVFDSLAYIVNLKNPETTANGLFIEHNAATGTLTNGLNITSTAGAITTGILIADGAGTIATGITMTGTFTNLIDTPNFDVSNAGAVVAVGVNSGAGLLQGALGLTITGAAVSLNATSNFDVNIATGTSTGAVSIGNALAGAIALSTSSTFGVTTTTSAQTYTSANVSGATTSSAFVFTDSALTSGTLDYLTSSSVTTGRLLDISTAAANTWTGNGTTNGLVNLASSSTAGTASSSSILLNLARSGPNAQLAHTAYGVYSAVTNTNVTSGTNVAGYFSASGATTANYGLIVENGNVGIGTTAPSTSLHIQKTSAGALTSPLFLHNKSATAATKVSLDFGVDSSDTAMSRITSDRLDGNGNTNLQFQTYTAFVGLNTGMVLQYDGSVGIGDTAPSTKLAFGGTGSANGITFGDDAVDPANLYRSAANTLKTDDSMAIDGASGLNLTNTGAPGILIAASSAGTNTSFSTRVSADGAERFNLKIDGKHSWGSGSVAMDTNLYRSAADTLKTDDAFIAGRTTVDATIVTQSSVALCYAGGVTATAIIEDCFSSPTDLAENFGTSDSSIEAGDIVTSDPSRPAQAVVMSGVKVSKAYVLKSTKSYESGLLGIVSTHPNQLYGDDGLFDDTENPRPVSLAGRVPAKVSTENGPIAIGDPITSSSVPGVGMKATKPGRVIGIALESLPASQGETLQGKIMVFVNPTWYLGASLVANGSLGDWDSGLLGNQDPTAQQPNYLIAQNITNADGTLSAQYKGQILSSEQIQKLVREEVARQVAVLGFTSSVTASASAAVSTQIATSSATPRNDATDSAALADQTNQTLTDLNKLLATTNLKLDTLTVIGNSMLAATQVAGTLSQDGTLIIDLGKQINVLGNTLFLQNDSLAGDINCHPGVATTTIGSDSIASLQNDRCGVLVDIGAGKVTIDKDGNVKIAGDITANSLTLAASKTAGSGKVLAGQGTVVVQTPAVDTNSKVIVTFTSDYVPATRYAVVEKSIGSGFRVSLDAPVAADSSFDWIIIGAREVSQN